MRLRRGQVINQFRDFRVSKQLVFNRSNLALVNLGLVVSQ